jgi:hypothetical protein
MTKRKFTWTLLILLYIVSLIVAESPMALADGRLVIPIYYATDRRLNENATGNLDYTLEQVDGDRLNYGVKNVVVPGKPNGVIGDNMNCRLATFKLGTPN